MSRIIRLTEQDIARIVERSINEMKESDQSDVTIAMDMVREYLKNTGGTMGSRSTEEILESLEALEYAIRTEKNDLEVYMQRPNPHFRKSDFESSISERRLRGGNYIMENNPMHMLGNVVKPMVKKLANVVNPPTPMKKLGNVLKGKYAVKSGDTFEKIAKSYGTTVDALKKLNPLIKDINLIKPGQILNVE